MTEAGSDRNGGLTEPDGRNVYDLYSFDEKSYGRWHIEAHHGHGDGIEAEQTLYFFIHFMQRADGLMRSVRGAALLHDAVEDTEITFEDLEKNFPEEVVEALRFLTRDKSMNYFDYIRNLRKESQLAEKVEAG
ncbi:MAG: hypothetical protein ACLU6Y_08965 [Ruminococcus sp.]